MYSDEIIKEEEEVEEINIVPISKWKRILLYFADLMINLMLTFLLYNLAIVPLGKVMTKYNEKDEQYSINSTIVVEVLYGNEVLFQKPETSELDYQAALEYTCDCYLTYYAFDDVESIDTNYPDFGHKEKNNVLYTYFVGIRNDKTSYLSFFEKYNSKNGYFVKSNEDTYELKAEIKEQVQAIFDPRDEASKDGKEIYENLKNNFFSKMYGEMMKDIETNDLLFEGKSYNEAKGIVDQIDIYHGNLLSISAIISYLLSSVIVFIIFPIFNRHHRTVAMLLMRVERINVDRLYIVQKKEVIFNAIYGFASGMYITFFVPLSYVTINYLFSMPTLLVVAVASIAFALASFITLLANNYNRSISDLFTNSVLIDNAELDKIYKARGYVI